MNEVLCKQCGAKMKKTKKAESNYALQVVGVILFIVGVVVTFSGVGVLIGLPLMVASLFLGYSKKKVMACESCSYFYEIM